MIIRVAGTKEGESIHLITSRKPEGTLRPGEVAHTDASGKVTSYRKKLQNSTIRGFALNRIQIQDSEYEGRPTRSYTLYITSKGVSHIVNLGGGMVAKGVVNSLSSLSVFSVEENSKEDLELGFYKNKQGYNSYSIRKGTELLSWKISPEEGKALTIKAPNPVKAGEFLFNYENLDARYNEIVAEVNAVLPHAEFGNALDEDEAVTPSTSEEVFGSDQEEGPGDRF